MIPCKDCLTLAICKSLDLHDLVIKCEYMHKYLKVNWVGTRMKNGELLCYTIHSHLNRGVHRFRMRKIKKYIPHTHTLNH